MKKKIISTGICLLGASFLAGGSLSALSAKEIMSNDMYTQQYQAQEASAFFKKKDKDAETPAAPQATPATPQNEQKPSTTPSNAPGIKPSQPEQNAPKQAVPKAPQQQQPTTPEPEKKPDVKDDTKEQKPSESSMVDFESTVALGNIFIEEYDDIVNFLQYFDMDSIPVNRSNMQQFNQGGGQGQGGHQGGHQSGGFHQGGQQGGHQGGMHQRSGGASEYLPDIADQIKGIVDKQAALKIDPSAYIVQHEDGLWLIMGNIRAKLDVLIYVDSKNTTGGSQGQGLEKGTGIPLYK